jgi:hypothetical protein
MRTLFRATLLAATLCGAAALAPAAAQAPDARHDAPAPAAGPAADGPTLAAARIAARPAEREGEAPAAAAAALSRPAKFLIFGGAILLTGAIVGDDAGTVMMIGGGAIALYGLYQMLFEGETQATSVTFTPPAPYREGGDARR